MTDACLPRNRRMWRGVLRGLLVAFLGALSVLIEPNPQVSLAAAGGSLYLDGLVSSMKIDVAVPFTASLTNDGPEPVAEIRIIIHIVATGMEPQFVRIERRNLDGGWAGVTTKSGNKGDVSFFDTSYKDRVMAIGGALTGRYRLTFLSGSPHGMAIIRTVSQYKKDGGWQSLADSPQYVTQVVVASGGIGGAAPKNGHSPSVSAQRSSTSQILSSPAATVGPPTGPGGYTRQNSAVVDDPFHASRFGSAGSRQSWDSRIATMVGIAIIVCMLSCAAWVLRRLVYIGQAVEICEGGSP